MERASDFSAVGKRRPARLTLNVREPTSSDKSSMRPKETPVLTSLPTNKKLFSNETYSSLRASSLRPNSAKAPNSLLSVRPIIVVGSASAYCVSKSATKPCNSFSLAILKPCKVKSRDFEWRISIWSSSNFSVLKVDKIVRRWRRTVSLRLSSALI